LENVFIQRVRQFSLWQPLAARDFRLLWLGQGVSLFGDQFYLVALPWLTLALTGSGLKLGTVLMVTGGARAVFQLVGGALTDRMSPRTIMLVSNLVRAVVTGILTANILLGPVHLWHLYILALAFGLVDAFFYPAYLAVIPTLIEKDNLTAGNALMRGTSRLMGIIGPAAAGLVISSRGFTTTPVIGAALDSALLENSSGFAAAFAIDTLSFLFAALMVWLMRERKPTGDEERAPEAPKLKGLINSIREGLAYAWRDPLIRSLLLFIAAIEFSFIGPSTVGLAVLSKNRFGGGEASSQGGAAFAAILATFGAGMLAGMLVAGSIKLRRRGRLIIGTMFMLGVGLALLGLSTHVVAACVIFGFVGLGGGMSNIIVLSWLQSRTDSRMLGRVMSLVMFGVSLLEPLSYALFGALADFNVTLMFAAGGAVLLVTSVFSLASYSLRASD
jgi:MFS family permease